MTMAEPLFPGKTSKEEFDDFVSAINIAVNEVARDYDLHVVSGEAKHNIGSRQLSYTLKIEKITDCMSRQYRMPDAKDAKRQEIEPAFQPSYNPHNVEGMCAPHVFGAHEGKMICRKCGWKPELCQTQNAEKSKPSSGDRS